MERGTVDPTPDLDELQQAEVSYPTVPVRGEGTFLVQQLPARRVQEATDLIPAGAWTPILPGTPKRARTVLLSTDTDFRYSSNGTGSGMLWPVGLPLELRHAERIYVMSDDPAGSTVSHFTELWAD